MASEIIKRDLKENINSKAIVFLHNGFRFNIKILDVDDEFLKAADIKKLCIKYFRISEIENIELNSQEGLK